MDEDYQNPILPGSLGGISKFRKEQIRKGQNISTEQAKAALERVDSYSIYKKAKQKFLTRPVVTLTIDHIWDIDLLSIPGDLVEYNDGFTFILGAIDIFSRFAFAVPIKNKTAAIVLQGFKDLLASTARSPHIVRSDAGREFNNKSFQTFLKDNGITHFTNSTLKKANYIERWFRTIKVKFFRYLHNNNTKRFIDKLPEFVSSYNNTFHRILKARPSSVNYKNELKFYRSQKKRGNQYISKNIKHKFSVGEQVRISYLARPFMRSSDQQHTPEIFTVTKRYRRQGLPIYLVKDCSDQEIKGKFYAEELTLVRTDPDKIWPIEKVFRNKKKKIRGVQHFLVKWKNYPMACASYVPETDLVDI